MAIWYGKVKDVPVYWVREIFISVQPSFKEGSLKTPVIYGRPLLRCQNIALYQI